jgi:hypothetical protein
MARGGSRPNSGGARPGAGRKSKATLDYQGTMRAVFEEVVTPEDWKYVVSVALAHAKAGKDDARRWLSPWIVGAEPKEMTVVHQESEGEVAGLLKRATAEQLAVLDALLNPPESSA